MDELADSASLLHDQDGLRRHLAEDGNLFFRGLSRVPRRPHVTRLCPFPAARLAWIRAWARPETASM